MIQWQWRTFQELSTHELYDILALRESVFIIEQNCKQPDIDNRDQQCMHLLGIQNKKLTAYLRVLPKGLAYADAISFGRVAIAPHARNLGLGKQAVNQALELINKNDDLTPLHISAQLHLENFYKSFGFKSIGQPYDEAGIMHIEMKKHG